jgi:hypothetical protein
VQIRRWSLEDTVRDLGLPAPTSRAGATRRGSARHALGEVDVLAVIRCVHEANYGAYGSGRVAKVLQRQGALSASVSEVLNPVAPAAE